MLLLSGRMPRVGGESSWITRHKEDLPKSSCRHAREINTFDKLLLLGKIHVGSRFNSVDSVWMGGGSVQMVEEEEEEHVWSFGCHEYAFTKIKKKKTREIIFPTCNC